MVITAVHGSTVSNIMGSTVCISHACTYISTVGNGQHSSMHNRDMQPPNDWPLPRPLASVFWKCPQLGSCVSGGSVGPALWGEHRAGRKLVQALIMSSGLQHAITPDDGG
jgi:hypothetical protein